MGKLICIDPGHGGIQPGAVRGGLMEKDATLQIANMVANILRDSGFDVVMTRDTDEDVSLRKRCDIANNAGADAFISIHLNAAKSMTAHGAETWKWHTSTSTLADCVQAELIEATGAKDRGVKLSKTFVVLRYTVAPAVVVECGFISNGEERARLFDGDYQERIALGIAKGIVEAFNARCQK